MTSMQYYKGMLKQRGLQLIQRLETKLRRYHRPLQKPRKVDLEQLDGETVTFTAPTFVLSTGRCGTLWLTRLLRLSKYVYVNHSDYPELIRHSRLAYEGYQQRPQVFQEIVRATRDEFLLRAYRYGQCYVETNNRMTFFAEAAKAVYPRARFIHLVRHPGDFVRSGLNRGWYAGQQRHELGRIRGTTPQWEKLSRRAKIAWLWERTNCYIETFSAGLSEDDLIRIRAEDMFNDPQIVGEICQFIGAEDISRSLIDSMQTRVINQQKKVTIQAPYPHWRDAQKEELRKQITLADHYGYTL
jgi:hypothetical protein